MDIGFNDIKEIVQQGVVEGKQFTSLRSDEGDFQTMKIGSGDKSLKIDEQGIWAGTNQFESADFYIDMNGNMYMKAATGDSYLLLDSDNSKIVVNDGTENVITMGKQADGSYGIDIANGKLEGAWIVADSITASQIAANTITATEIAADTITTTEIKAGTIEASDIKTDTITATQIATGAIDTSELAADAVTASKIDVDNLAAIKANLGTVTAGIINFSGSGSNYILLPYGSSTTGHLRWGNNNNKMWVDSNGYMGQQASGGRMYFYLSTSVYMLLQSSTHSANIYATTTFTRDLKPEANNTYDLGSDALEWKDIWATNTTIQSSDERLKKSIKQSDLGLDFINKLSPISYIWKDKGKRRHYGLVAQNVEKVLNGRDFAGLIISESGKYGLRYGEFIAPMVKAIQELNDKIVELKKV